VINPRHEPVRDVIAPELVERAAGCADRRRSDLYVWLASNRADVGPGPDAAAADEVHALPDPPRRWARCLHGIRRLAPTLRKLRLSPV
jgi:hypothetical protein